MTALDEHLVVEALLCVDVERMRDVAAFVFVRVARVDDHYLVYIVSIQLVQYIDQLFLSDHKLKKTVRQSK